MIENVSLTEIALHRDARGTLVSLEGGRDMPFDVARVYCIVDGCGSRGFHAHRGLWQLMTCIKGSCRLVVDDGRERQEHLLDRPDIGLFVGPMVWREMHDFSDDSVLLVLASAPYDEADYIRDYDAFLAAAGVSAA